MTFKELKFISWNVRGMNNDNKKSVIKKYLKEIKPDLFTLQETKMEEITHNIVKKVGGNNSSSYSYLKSQGASGGILICWKNK